MPAADVHQSPGPAVAVPAASDVPTSVPVEPDPEPVVQPQEPEVLPFIPAGDEFDRLVEGFEFPEPADGPEALPFIPAGDEFDRLVEDVPELGLSVSVEPEVPVPT
jgi:hypothetical protein